MNEPRGPHDQYAYHMLFSLDSDSDDDVIIIKVESDDELDETGEPNTSNNSSSMGNNGDTNNSTRNRHGEAQVANTGVVPARVANSGAQLANAGVVPAQVANTGTGLPLVAPDAYTIVSQNELNRSRTEPRGMMNATLETAQQLAGMETVQAMAAQANAPVQAAAQTNVQPAIPTIGQPAAPTGHAHGQGVLPPAEKPQAAAQANPVSRGSATVMMDRIERHIGEIFEEVIDAIRSKNEEKLGKALVKLKQVANLAIAGGTGAGDVGSSGDGAPTNVVAAKARPTADVLEATQMTGKADSYPDKENCTLPGPVAKKQKK